MEPNRLMRQWPLIKRRLAERYPRVPAGMWDRTEGQHDLIVRCIRDVYIAGRSELSVEAEVRDFLNECCADIEEDH
ncbi:MAG: hypothetical protein HY543_12545 [Deltaproteobacteria bacterium]|nr:hypothetical protein [Deltaproteobacteria bacterium]